MRVIDAIVSRNQKVFEKIFQQKIAEKIKEKIEERKKLVGKNIMTVGFPANGFIK
jgi:hypothetical protein